MWWANITSAWLCAAAGAAGDVAVVVDAGDDTASLVAVPEHPLRVTATANAAKPTVATLLMLSTWCPCPDP